MLDPITSQVVHVIDDEPSFRRSLVNSLAPSGWKCREYPHGDAFLKALRWGWRGILTLDISMGSEADGWSIARRLVESRCHMPIVILTGFPLETTRKNVGLFASRADIEFLMKSTEPPELRQVLRELMAREPALYREAENERDLRQTAVTTLTKTDRKVLSLAMQGKESADIVDILNLHDQGGIPYVNEYRRKALAKLPWADNMIAAAAAFSPLYVKQGVANLVELAVDEVCWRLRQLDVEHLACLMQALSDRQGPRLLPRAQTEHDVLRVLQVPSISFVKNTWLKWLAQDELAAALPRLSGDALAPLRDWLSALQAGRHPTPP